MSQYALGYVLAEESKERAQDWKRLRKRCYKRHDIPKIKYMFGCNYDNAIRQFSSKCYVKSYDDSKKYMEVKIYIEMGGMCVEVCVQRQ